MTARLLLSGVATAALMAPAMALDADAFIDRVETVWKGYGYDLQFGAATLDGNSVVVDGLTVTIATSPEAGMEPLVIDTQITFSNVAEGADGSYTAESISVPDIDTEFSADPVGRLTLRDISLEGFYVPGADKGVALGSMQWLEYASTGPLSVTRNGQEVFSIASTESRSTFNPSQTSDDLIDLHSRFAINGISADLSSAEDLEAKQVIEALGLTAITGDITADLTWSMADGHMIFNEFLFDFDNIGAINIKTDLTGLTLDVLDKIYAMQAAISSDGEMTEEQAQAQMMQGMALMQGVSIVSASVRYDDASLAGKLLDFFAAQSGADRPGFVEGLKAMLPVVLAETGIPALSDLVVPPVSAFLDDPQSLEVKVAPASPTSLLVLMAAAANPAGLISALGLAVEANTPAQ